MAGYCGKSNESSRSKIFGEFFSPRDEVPLNGDKVCFT